MKTSLTSLFGKELSTPIDLFIYEIDGRYYASNSVLKIFEFGDSEQEATDRFIHEIEYMYNQYTKIK